MSFEDFLIGFILTKREPFLRIGQHLYIALYYVRPDVAKKICGNGDDCFYVDAKIPTFLKRAKELW